MKRKKVAPVRLAASRTGAGLFLFRHGTVRKLAVQERPFSFSPRHRPDANTASLRACSSLSRSEAGLNSPTCVVYKQDATLVHNTRSPVYRVDAERRVRGVSRGHPRLFRPWSVPKVLSVPRKIKRHWERAGGRGVFKSALTMSDISRHMYNRCGLGSSR